MIFLTSVLGVMAIFTSVISGVVGMAGGIVLLSLMTFFIPLQHIVPIHGVVQLVSNGSRCFFLRKKIVKEIALYFFLGAPIGTLGTYFFLSHISAKAIFYWPIILLILYTLFKPKKMPTLMISHKNFFFLGLAGGFLAPLIGATGPLVAPFFLRPDLEKEEIVATKACIQMFTHFLKIPLFLSLSFSYAQYSWVIVSMVVGAIIGTRLGVFLLGKISELLFKRIYQTALFIAVIRLIVKLWA